MAKGRYLMSKSLLKQLMVLPEDVDLVTITPAEEDEQGFPLMDTVWVEVEGPDVPEGVVYPTIDKLLPADGSEPTFVWHWNAVDQPPAGGDNTKEEV